MLMGEEDSLHLTTDVFQNNGAPQTNKIRINDFYDHNKSAINKPTNKIHKYD